MNSECGKLYENGVAIGRGEGKGKVVQVKGRDIHGSDLCLNKYV